MLIAYSFVSDLQGADGARAWFDFGGVVAWSAIAIIEWRRDMREAP